jgi:hypothetical protein
VPREVRGGLGSASHVLLRHDARDVDLHGLLGQVTFVADLAVRLPVRDEAEGETFKDPIQLIDFSSP